jgi:CheY-like chemotaxis protein
VPSPKILIVEDNHSDVYLLRRALEDQRNTIDIEIAPDGECALQFVQNQRLNRHDHLPCVIVLDLHLPKHDGLEVLRAIQQEPVLHHIHVIVVAGMASPEEQAQLRRMGVDVRTKPSGLSGFELLAAELIAICEGLETPA